jgi:hypothetical protein
MVYAKRKLGTFKNKVSSNNAMKLTSSNVFPWIRDSIVLGLETELGTKSPVEACSSAVIRKDNSLFDTVTYNPVPKLKPGKLAWIAQ